MLVAHHDFESSSTCDLRRTGAYRYAEDPETRVWMMSWRIGDGPVRRWRPGEPDPAEFLDHVARGGRAVAHNASFERLIWNTTLRSKPEYRHWPELKIAQQDCTMSRALAVHLPADLDTLGRVLGLATQKDKDGGRLMLKMAKPRRIYAAQDVTAALLDEALAAPDEWTFRPDGGAVRWWNTPENVARLGAYCDVDVETECGVDAKLPPLSDEERELWERDQAVNDRGVALDVATIGRAVGVRAEALRRADARMAELTGGQVRRCTESGRLVAWLAARGVPCESVAKDGHDELRLSADVLGDAAAREAVDLRAQATRTSTAKLEKMLDVICSNGRAHGLFKYHSAGPGRWGGLSIQPQNLVRVDEKKELPIVLDAIEALQHADAIEVLSVLAQRMPEPRDRSVMGVLAKMARAMFVAAPG